RRIHLAELALDHAVRSSEAPPPSCADVHLLDDRAVPPPFGNQGGVGPDGEDVRARRVEHTLDPDLELVRRGDSRVVHDQPTAFFTSARIFFSSAAVSSVSA